MRLEHLSLNYNEIERLPPDAFAGLGNLKRLFLYQNKLADLPDDIFNPLASLQVLALSAAGAACAPNALHAHFLK